MSVAPGHMHSLDGTRIDVASLAGSKRGVGALGCGMAPIRWFSHRGPRLGGVLLGGCLAFVLTAAPAAGAISSVDAYGGQAQVLGKPVHRHGAATGSTPARGSGRAGGQGAGASGAQAGGGSAGLSPGSGSNSTAGSGSGTPTASSGSHSAAGAGSGAAGGGGGGAGAAGTGGASGASGAGHSPPIAAANLADVSEGSLSLRALDVLLLVAVAAGLVGVGVLIRRSSRQSE
jgi:hypothetical protein